MTNNAGAFCGGAGLVDDVLGDAYRAVKTVYDNMAFIQAIAMNMTAIQRAASNINRKTAFLEVETAVAGESSSVSIPDVVGSTAITDFAVMVTGNDGQIYSASGGLFQATIDGRFVVVTLSSDADANLENAVAKISIFYQG